MGFGDLVNGINVWPISEGDFAAVGVADEFADDALENALPVSHEGGLERGQIADLPTVGQFHGGLNGNRGELDFLLEGGWPVPGIDFLHVAILVPLTPNRVVIFQSETERVDFRVTAGAAFELLMLEDGLADGGGAQHAIEHAAEHFEKHEEVEHNSEHDQR